MPRRKKLIEVALPLEAIDLNPVPVPINKALIEIPPKFAGHSGLTPLDLRRSDEKKL